MGELDGRRVVVTGSSRGLGRAFALALAREGASVVVNGTQRPLVESVVETIRSSGGVAEAVVGSVADDDVAEALVARCVESFGGVDAVVNNAGIVRDRTLANMTPDEFDDAIVVNLRGTWSVSRHAVRAMRESGKGGLLLQIISGSAFVGSVGQTNYAASKAGVMGMLYAWDVELARFGIRTNALWPVAETDMTQVVFANAAARAAQSGGSPPTAAELGFGTPDAVAQVVVYLCSDRAAGLRSQLLSFNGRRLAVWQHPREHEPVWRDTWGVDDFDAVLHDAHEAVHRPRLTEG